MNKAKVTEAMSVINGSQNRLWSLSHETRLHDKKLGEAIWEQTLQIEHALLVLNEEVLGGESYFEGDGKPTLDSDDDGN